MVRPSLMLVSASIAYLFACSSVALGASPVRRHVQKGMQEPVLPFEHPGACPFEGCQYGAWVARADTSVYRGSSEASLPVATIRKGDRVTALSGTVITTKVGRVTFLKSTVLHGEGGPMRASAGSTACVLHPIGEGCEQLWYRGKLASFCPEDRAARFLGDAEYQWWARVQLTNGVLGWVNMKKANFDGTDRFGD